MATEHDLEQVPKARPTINPAHPSASGSQIIKVALGLLLFAHPEKPCHLVKIQSDNSK